MDEPPQLLINLLSILNPNLSASDSTTVIFGFIAVLLLLVCSAVLSGSENAFFSLNKTQFEELISFEGSVSKSVSYLLRFPKKLLATVLIANTLINVAIVMVTTAIFAIIFDFEHNPIFGFAFEVVVVTFVIVLFGEVIPKIYAVQNNTKVVKSVAVGMYSIYKILYPLVWVLENSTSIIDKRMTSKGHILTVDELTHAIDITSEKDAPKQEKNILKSIVNFGNITVNQIMRQRPDIIGVKYDEAFNILIKGINEWGYSRLPVYDENFDTIKGILYTKDLLPHLNKDNDFNWHTLIREPFFVPESKKIDDLLKDFQTQRMHLAIVVDEFGGTCGLVTMEDILEEIFGEINDEFDEDEHVFSKLNDTTFVFEAKMQINDICKYMEIEQDVFEKIRNDADTLGGMLLELNGDLPYQGQEIEFQDFVFKIESVDKRRIKRVKITLVKNEADSKN